MPQASSIRRLPPEIKAEVDRLLRDGQATIDQIITQMIRGGPPTPPRTDGIVVAPWNP